MKRMIYGTVSVKHEQWQESKVAGIRHEPVTVY